MRGRKGGRPDLSIDPRSRQSSENLQHEHLLATKPQIYPLYSGYFTINFLPELYFHYPYSLSSTVFVNYYDIYISHDEKCIISTYTAFILPLTYSKTYCLFCFNLFCVL